MKLNQPLKILDKFCNIIIDHLMQIAHLILYLPNSMDRSANAMETNRVILRLALGVCNVFMAPNKHKSLSI